MALSGSTTCIPLLLRLLQMVSSQGRVIILGLPKLWVTQTSKYDDDNDHDDGDDDDDDGYVDSVWSRAFRDNGRQRIIASITPCIKDLLAS